MQIVTMQIQGILTNNFPFVILSAVGAYATTQSKDPEDGILDHAAQGFSTMELLGHSRPRDSSTIGELQNNRETPSAVGANRS